VALAVNAGALAGSTVAYMESNTKVSKSSRTISIVEWRWRNSARCRGELQGGFCLYCRSDRQGSGTCVLKEWWYAPAKCTAGTTGRKGATRDINSVVRKGGLFELLRCPYLHGLGALTGSRKKLESSPNGLVLSRLLITSARLPNDTGGFLQSEGSKNHLILARQTPANRPILTTTIAWCDFGRYEDYLAIEARLR